MVRDILKINQDMGLGVNDPTFKNIELTAYQYKATRMGMSELTATLMWPTCLDNEWTGKEYVTLRGERFFIRHTPTSEKDHSDTRYKHEITFTSESAEILGGTYFVDAVPDYAATHNKPSSNSTVFTFYGTISEFVDRLNCAFLYAGVADSILKRKTSLSTSDVPTGDGFCAMIDPYGSYDANKVYDFSFEDTKIWDAILNFFEVTEVPFELHGKKIVFGAVSQVLDHTFKYGDNNELISITKDNEKNQSVNRITMIGSDENIPYYYPNETEYGHIELSFGSSSSLDDSILTLSMPSKLVKYIPQGVRVVLREIKESQANIQNHSMQVKAPSDTNFIDYNNTFISFEINPETDEPTITSRYIDFKFNFKTSSPGVISIDGIIGQVWRQNESSQGTDSNLLTSNAIVISSFDGSQNITVDKDNGKIKLGVVESGSHSLIFSVEIPPAMTTADIDTIFVRVSSVKYTTPYTAHKYYWEADSKTYDDITTLGVSIADGTINEEMVGDGFSWFSTGRMPFQTNLMPPKYRNTNGAERFYNALNNTYIDPDTGKYYAFARPFVDGNPSEHIYKDENIKPTIEGIRNDVMVETDANGRPIGQLFGVIADIAYDKDDNDSLKAEATDDDKNDSLKYEHSFFYIKLNVFSGSYGFDLFQHASQTDAMTLQMRDGACAGCNFKIQVLKEKDNGVEVWKNPVQTDGAGGNIVDGNYDDKVNTRNIQPWQQNTQMYSIWICVQKDADTFGVIMPNISNNFRPKIGDTFNIINIVLPIGYIRAAEQRLEDNGIRFMSDNNGETFSFDIAASRIFFAQNPSILAQLNEYSKLRVIFDNTWYELYVNELTIDCSNNEPLPNIGIALADKLTTGQSFTDSVAERAASIVANAYTLGGYIGGGSGSGGGLSPALAEQRYLNKQRNDRTPFKLSTNTAFEVGEFVSGASGGMFFVNQETGASWLETDYLKVRMKSIFEELIVSKNSSISGKQTITPGGGITISFIEDLPTSWRCYFKASDGDTKTKCLFVVNDQAQCSTFNVVSSNSQNHFYWRLVTAVNNNESYIELSKSDCAAKSDAPQLGDTIVQFGNRDNVDRQSAIVLSTADATSPCVTLYNNINNYSLDNKAVIEYGVDYTKKQPTPFFHCYGDLFVGPKTNDSYLNYDSANKRLEFKGRLDIHSTIGDEPITTAIGSAVQEVDTLFIQSESNTIVPDLPVVDSKGFIVNYNGWSTNAPVWRPDRYIWQTTYTRDGNNNAHFSPPTCISGINGANGSNYTANMLYKSYNSVTNDHYVMATYNLAEKPVVGDIYTITLWGQLAETKSYFSVYNGDGYVRLANLAKIGNGVYQAIFKWANALGDGSHPADDTHINVYAFTNTQTGTSTIDRIKLEKGSNSNPEWTPAPSEMLAPTITEQYYLSTSDTELIGDTWHDTKPTWITGRFYWTRTKIEYQNGDINYTEPICVTGANGSDAYILDLDNEVAGVACDANGNVVGVLPMSNIRVYSGTNLDTGWSFSIAPNGNIGCTAGITNSILTVTSLTSDEASVKVQAKKIGAATLYATMSIYKVKPGLDGVPGSGFTDNLYLNSAFTNNDSHWFYWNTPSSKNVIDGELSILTSQNTQILYNELIAVEKGEQFTLSGWIRADEDIQLNYNYLIYSDGDNQRIEFSDNNLYADVWRFCIIQFTAKKNGFASAGFGYNAITNVTIDFKELKWERGFNNAPVWNPAISELSAVVYSLGFSANNISRNALGTLSANTLTVYKYKTVGNASMTLTTEKNVRYNYVYNNVSGSWINVSPGVDTFNISIPSDNTLTAVIVELYDDNMVLDREHIPVISEGSVPTENLVRDSEVNIQSSDYMMCTLKLSDDLVPGRKYTITIWGRAASGKTFSVYGSTDELLIVTLNEIADGIYSSSTIITSDFNLTNDKRTIRIMCDPASNTNISIINKVKVEHDVNIAPIWTPSPKDIDYLKEAMKESATFDGGLILASLMQLGYTAENGEYKTMAGVNGIYAPNEKGGGLYTWGGGKMIDPDGTKNGTPSTSGIRHDGTAYFCNNVVRFKEESVEIGDNVHLGRNGLTLVTSNNTSLQIGDIAVGDILTSSNFFESLTNANNCSTSISLYNDRYGSWWPVGTSNIVPIKNTEVPKGTILNGSGVINITCSDTYSFAGTVFLDIFVGNTLIVTYGYQTPNVGYEWSIGFSIPNTVIQQKGVVSMRLRWGNEVQPDWESAEDNPVGTATAIFTSGSLSYYTGNKTVNGKDGLLAVWGNSTFLCNKDEVRMRCGSYGFRVTSSGFQKLVNGAWVTVNL